MRTSDFNKVWVLLYHGNNLKKRYEICKTLCSMIFDCKSIQKSLEILVVELTTVTNRQ